MCAASSAFIISAAYPGKPQLARTMVKLTTTKGFISAFDLIAPSIWEFTPHPQYAHMRFMSKHIETPSLIILCTWTGAQSRHIAKFTTEYQSFFPCTRIMIITSSTKDLCFWHSRRGRSCLQPAVERISGHNYLNKKRSSGDILLHIFSEGGFNKACELAESYYGTNATRLPVSALCFDSAPGRLRYLRLCKALNQSLPHMPVIRLYGVLLDSAIISCLWILYTGTKRSKSNVISRTCRRMHDPTHFDPAAPRCYLYSTRDALIAWQDVHEHADESVRAGIPVTEVLFEASGHVGHVRQEPAKYWNAIMETWQERNFTKKQVGQVDIGLIKAQLAAILPNLPATAESWRGTDSQRSLVPKARLRTYTMAV
jgi:hypothetical protein